MDDKEIEKWSKKMEEDHGKKLDGLLANFHSQTLSPQRLRAHIHSHPKDYTDVLHICSARKNSPKRKKRM